MSEHSSAEEHFDLSTRTGWMRPTTMRALADVATRAATLRESPPLPASLLDEHGQLAPEALAIGVTLGVPSLELAITRRVDGATGSCRILWTPAACVVHGTPVSDGEAVQVLACPPDDFPAAVVRAMRIAERPAATTAVPQCSARELTAAVAERAPFEIGGTPGADLVLIDTVLDAPGTEAPPVRRALVDGEHGLWWLVGVEDGAPDDVRLEPHSGADEADWWEHVMVSVHQAAVD